MFNGNDNDGGEEERRAVRRSQEKSESGAPLLLLVPIRTARWSNVSQLKPSAEGGEASRLTQRAPGWQDCCHGQRGGGESARLVLDPASAEHLVR